MSVDVRPPRTPSSFQPAKKPRKRQDPVYWAEDIEWMHTTGETLEGIKERYSAMLGRTVRTESIRDALRTQNRLDLWAAIYDRAYPYDRGGIVPKWRKSL